MNLIWYVHTNNMTAMTTVSLNNYDHLIIESLNKILAANNARHYIIGTINDGCPVVALIK